MKETEKEQWKASQTFGKFSWKPRPMKEQNKHIIHIGFRFCLKKSPNFYSTIIHFLPVNFS